MKRIMTLAACAALSAVALLGAACITNSKTITVNVAPSDTSTTNAALCATRDTVTYIATTNGVVAVTNHIAVRASATVIINTADPVIKGVNTRADTDLSYIPGT